MRASIGTFALGLALLLTGCGEGGNGGKEGTKNNAPVASIPAPNGGDWTQTVTETPQGSFVMGNPNAPVKLVEFGSFTCPHCAKFSEEGTPELINNYVKTGQVSFEYRNFVRDPADLAASLLARCGGPTPFFTLTDQIFAAQNEWLGRLQTALTPADQQAMQSMAPGQVANTVADKAGLTQFVRMRGIPEEKARTCLADQQATERLVAMTNEGTQRYQVPGTPSFLINGELVPDTADWKSLQPKLREALGG
jgi:protein-disulfide isomerase